MKFTDRIFASLELILFLGKSTWEIWTELSIHETAKAWQVKGPRFDPQLKNHR